MALVIRDVREDELETVRTLNNSAGRTILVLENAQLQYFFDHADYFRVAEIDGQLAGFLIALREAGEYGSPNYRWFGEHYASFLYIDRIVIGNAYRGHGLGRVFYCDVASFAEVRVPCLTCEVFLESREDAVLLFHGIFGFQEVGQQRMGEHGPKVSLLLKELPSFAYVRDTWLSHGGLPDLPWLSGRLPPLSVAWPASATYPAPGSHAA